MRHRRRSLAYRKRHSNGRRRRSRSRKKSRWIERRFRLSLLCQGESGEVVFHERHHVLDGNSFGSDDALGAGFSGRSFDYRIFGRRRRRRSWRPEFVRHALGRFRSLEFSCRSRQSYDFGYSNVFSRSGDGRRHCQFVDIIRLYIFHHLLLSPIVVLSPRCHALDLLRFVILLVFFLVRTFFRRFFHHEKKNREFRFLARIKGELQDENFYSLFNPEIL